MPFFFALFFLSLFSTFIIRNKIQKIIVIYILSLIFIGLFFWSSAYLRFFLVIFPFVIITISQFIIKTSKLSKNKFFNLLIIVILISPLLITQEFTIYPQEYYNLQEPNTNFDLAYKCVYERINPQDKIISITTGGTPPYFYLREKFDLKNNYVLSFDILNHMDSYKAIYVGEHYIEGYSNIPIITDIGQFKEVINNSSGYVIFDQQKLFHVDKEGKKILSNLNYLKNCSDKSIKVYYWKSN